MGWLIALAAVLGLGLLPLGVSAVYAEAGPVVRLTVGPFRRQIYPRKKPKNEEKINKKSVEKTEIFTQGGKLKDFIPLAKTAWEFLCQLRKRLKVRRLEGKLTMAGEDPCDLAVNYGRAWAALASLEPQLDRFFIIKKKDLQIQCDFETTETKIFARLDLTVTVYRLLGLLFRYGFRALGEYNEIQKLRKGGAVK